MDGHSFQKGNPPNPWDYVGYRGTGNEYEFDEIRQTEKAVCVRPVEFEDVEIWIPKSCISDDGGLTEYGCKLYCEKYVDNLKNRGL